MARISCIRKLVAFSFLSLLMTGCATLFTQVQDHRGEKVSYGFTVPRAYSGTVVDAHGLTADNAALFALIDLPLSLVLDTVIFPYTIFRQIRMGNIEETSK